MPTKSNLKKAAKNGVRRRNSGHDGSERLLTRFRRMISKVAAKLSGREPWIERRREAFLTFEEVIHRVKQAQPVSEGEKVRLTGLLSDDAGDAA